MAEREARVFIKVDDEGHIIAQIQGNMKNMEYIAAFELLKAKAVQRLADLTSPEIKIQGRNVT